MQCGTKKTWKKHMIDRWENHIIHKLKMCCEHLVQQHLFPSVKSIWKITIDRVIFNCGIHITVSQLSQHFHNNRETHLDHLALSSISFPSFPPLSSTKRRQICSTFVRYTRTSSLLYAQSRQRNGRSAFSLQPIGTQVIQYAQIIVHSFFIK